MQEKDYQRCSDTGELPPKTALRLKYFYKNQKRLPPYFVGTAVFGGSFLSKKALRVLKKCQLNGSYFAIATRRDAQTFHVSKIWNVSAVWVCDTKQREPSPNRE